MCRRELQKLVCLINHKKKRLRGDSFQHACTFIVLIMYERTVLSSREKPTNQDQEDEAAQI